MTDTKNMTDAAELRDVAILLRQKAEDARKLGNDGFAQYRHAQADRLEAIAARLDRCEQIEGELTAAYMAGFERGKDARMDAEPVAWAALRPDGITALIVRNEDDARHLADDTDQVVPLYAAPPAKPDTIAVSREDARRALNWYSVYRAHEYKTEDDIALANRLKARMDK